MSTETGLNSFEASKFLLISIAIVAGIASLLSILATTTHHSTTTANQLGRTFLTSIVALAIIYQFHLLMETSLHIIPSVGRYGSSRNSEELHRWDCLRSRKGGKRPYGDTSIEYRNPCYNRTAIGTFYENVLDDTSILHDSSSSICSSNTANANNNNNNNDDDDAGATIEPYVSSARDCSRAQSNECTYDQPCTPCELDYRREEFHRKNENGIRQQHAGGKKWARCRACSSSVGSSGSSNSNNHHGDECNFVVGVGPYCWKRSASAVGGLWDDDDDVAVVPCERCCTEYVPMYDEDGVCY